MYLKWEPPTHPTLLFFDFRWSLIAGRIPGRTDNEIKNYWNTHLSKKLISQGIDPRTHRPLNPNPNSHPPAPKPNPNPNPKPNTSQASSGLADTGGDDGEGHSVGSKTGQEAAYDAGGSWQNSDGLAAFSLQSGLENENEDDDMDNCTDDVFSSFLNSIINEDMFLQQHQQQNLVPPSDPLMLPAPNFGYGTMWEATRLAPTAANEDDHGRFSDNIAGHL